MVVQSDPAAPVTGRAADVISAAHTAMEAALRLVRPGHKISAVSEVLAKVRGAARSDGPLRPSVSVPHRVGSLNHGDLGRA